MVFLSPYVDCGMVAMRIFLLVDLYLKLCYLTHSTAKKWKWMRELTLGRSYALVAWGDEVGGGKAWG